MKGIVLAGGNGTRLYPITTSVSKQLLPICDKPMVYYPISILLQCGIREILVISTPQDIDHYWHLLGDGSNFGVTFRYMIQEAPRGLADAFILGEDFIGDDSVALVLGDNVIYGEYLHIYLKQAMAMHEGALIFGYKVTDPRSFGVVEFDEDGRAISIEEKPSNPKSNYAIPGIYFYDNNVISIAKNIQPSPRGELEISTVNAAYLGLDKLRVKVLDDNITWLDTGTYTRILDASNLVYQYQETTGKYIACLEEIAYKRGYIDKDKLIAIGNRYKNTEYGDYLLNIAKTFFIKELLYGKV